MPTSGGLFGSPFSQFLKPPVHRHDFIAAHRTANEFYPRCGGHVLGRLKIAQLADQIREAPKLFPGEMLRERSSHRGNDGVAATQSQICQNTFSPQPLKRAQCCRHIGAKRRRCRDAMRRHPLKTGTGSRRAPPHHYEAPAAALRRA
jgi:hypothetical protein